MWIYLVIGCILLVAILIYLRLYLYRSSKAMVDEISDFPVMIANPTSGLCNQLTMIINGMIVASRLHRSTVIYSPFLSCIRSQVLMNLDRVLDLKAMSSSLTLKTSSVFKIEYRIGNQYYDMTMDLFRMYGSKVSIARHPAISEVVLFTDGERRNITDEKTISYPEKFRDWSKVPYQFSWYNTFDSKRFNELVRSLRFQPIFYELADQCHLNAKPLHVVHFRVEEDAIAHWSKMNRMSAEEYEKQLLLRYRKYIALIPPKEDILFLTEIWDHPLISELRSTYTIHVFDHMPAIRKHFGMEARELAAIVDLILGSRCTGIFIGCHNFEHHRGSSFSYFIYTLISSPIIPYFIDLDHIIGSMESDVNS